MLFVNHNFVKIRIPWLPLKKSPRGGRPFIKSKGFSARQRGIKMPSL
jgi:hypothetical protein